MIVGFAGAGNMVAGMARGWAASDPAPEQMLFTDAGSGRAVALAAEVGGRALASNAELAGAADVVVLGFKPAALDDAAPELREARAVLSLLAATPLQRLRAAFPGVPAVRAMPNLGVQLRRGVICLAGAAEAPAALREELRALLGAIGDVSEMEDELIDPATLVMGCAPAYYARFAALLAEGGAAAGLDHAQSLHLAVETMGATAALLGVHEPAALERAVASPGGVTEAGLAALEREGFAGSVSAAVDASLARMRGDG